LTPLEKSITKNRKKKGNKNKYERIRPKLIYKKPKKIDT